MVNAFRIVAVAAAVYVAFGCRDLVFDYYRAKGSQNHMQALLEKSEANVANLKRTKVNAQTLVYGQEDYTKNFNARLKSMHSGPGSSTLAQLMQAPIPRHLPPPPPPRRAPPPPPPPHRPPPPPPPQRKAAAPAVGGVACPTTYLFIGPPPKTYGAPWGDMQMNNAINSIRNAWAVAQAMGRTLAVPPFRAHHVAKPFKWTETWQLRKMCIIDSTDLKRSRTAEASDVDMAKSQKFDKQFVPFQKRVQLMKALLSRAPGGPNSVMVGKATDFFRICLPPKQMFMFYRKFVPQPPVMAEAARVEKELLGGPGNYVAMHWRYFGYGAPKPRAGSKGITRSGSVDGDCLIRNTNDFEKAIQPNVMVTCHMRKDAIQAILENVTGGPIGGGSTHTKLFMAMPSHSWDALQSDSDVARYSDLQPVRYKAPKHFNGMMAMATDQWIMRDAKAWVGHATSSSSFTPSALRTAAGRPTSSTVVMWPQPQRSQTDFWGCHSGGHDWCGSPKIGEGKGKC